MNTTISMNQNKNTNPAIQANTANDNNIALNDWMPLYLEELENVITVNTYNNYNSYITKHILPELGNYKLTELTAPIIKQFIMNKLKNGRIRIRGEEHGLSTKTVKEHFILLKKALDKAVEEGKMMYNPCHSITFPKQTKPEVHALEQEEQAKLEAQITTPFTANSPLTAMIALYTGLRIGEVCALCLKDINFERGLINVSKTLYRTKTKSGKTEIVISKTKNKKQRYVPIPPELRQCLKEYIKSIPDELRNNAEQFLFVNKQNKPLEPRRLLYHFKILLKKAGLQNIKFHALRHTFATRCLECGIDMKIVSNILGHSAIQITADLYTHVTTRTMKNAMENFNQDNWTNA